MVEGVDIALGAFAGAVAEPAPLYSSGVGGITVMMPGFVARISAGGIVPETL